MTSKKTAHWTFFFFYFVLCSIFSCLRSAVEKRGLSYYSGRGRHVSMAVSNLVKCWRSVKCQGTAYARFWSELAAISFCLSWQREERFQINGVRFPAEDGLWWAQLWSRLLTFFFVFVHTDEVCWPSPNHAGAKNVLQSETHDFASDSHPKMNNWLMIDWMNDEDLIYDPTTMKNKECHFYLQMFCRFDRHLRNSCCCFFFSVDFLYLAELDIYGSLLQCSNTTLEYCQGKIYDIGRGSLESGHKYPQLLIKEIWLMYLYLWASPGTATAVVSYSTYNNVLQGMRLYTRLRFLDRVSFGLVVSVICWVFCLKRCIAAVCCSVSWTCGTTTSLRAVCK